MKKLVILFTALLCTTFMFSQKVKITQGSYAALKDIKEYNLEFDYSSLSIPKYNSEEDFLIDKMAKRDDKNPESGEKFKESWFADRENRYEPKFIESFNERFKNREIKVGKDLKTEYTLKIHTTMMWAGYNVGVWRENSKIEATIYVYKNDDPNTVLLAADFTRVEGGGLSGMDYNSGDRIAQAYGKLAKKLSIEIDRGAK